MSFIDGVQYDKEHEFTAIELSAITATNVRNWLEMKAYGMVNPGVNDQPTKGRSNSLAFAKKAVSHYMPRRLVHWDEIQQQGNPTKSIEVNNLISAVKKAEVRKQGKSSSARRALELQEFKSLISLLAATTNFNSQIRYVTYALLQFVLIARVDDICHFLVSDIFVHSSYNSVLACRLAWSKNVREERDSPEQILLGAMESRYCIQLNLAIYLEDWCNMGNGLGRTHFFSDDNDDDAPTRVKNAFSRILSTKVFKNTNFESLRDGPTGSHSLRKLASTYASRSGCSQSDVECRGRWRGQQRMVNRYIDTETPYVDAKVAAALCLGGPIIYKLEEGSGITDDWLLENVVPKLLNLYPASQNRVAKILALSLLWACLDPNALNMVPVTVRERITKAYITIKQLSGSTNPVKRVPVSVYRAADNLVIQEIIEMDGNEGIEGQHPHQQQAHQANEHGVQILFSKVHAMDKKLDDMKESIELSLHQSQAEVRNEIGKVNRNVQRIALVPAQRVQQVNNNLQQLNNNDQQLEVMFATTLASNPKDLYQLWHEYEFGIDGRKAAKDFSGIERGRVKFKFYRRKAFWDVVLELVRGGLMAEAAIDRVYSTYGVKESVTSILNKMLRDRKDKIRHPQLQV
jgi:hypothetical protein